MDTRFWGPSGWQLLHLIAEDPAADPEIFFNTIQDILPCKFCRASTAEYVQEIPVHEGMKDPGRWLYRLHNRVNQKLREQSKTDSNVRDPGPDPSFESVRERYRGYLKYTPSQLRGVIPGADFLFTLASNYPENPTSDQIQSHHTFWTQLVGLFPYAHYRSILAKYVEKRPVLPAMQSRSAYMGWVYTLLNRMCRGRMRSYRGMCQHVGYFKSACNNPTYRGKTCRRSRDGKYHKVRDHARTYRLTHTRLIPPSPTFVSPP